MRKYIFSLVALFFLAQTLTANVVTGVAAVPNGYYDDVDGKKTSEAILAALNGIISGHTVINYDGLSPITSRPISIPTRSGICIPRAVL